MWFNRPLWDPPFSDRTNDEREKVVSVNEEKKKGEIVKKKKKLGSAYVRANWRFGVRCLHMRCEVRMV